MSMSTVGKIRIKTSDVPDLKETTHVFGVGGPFMVPVRVTVMKATREVTLTYEPIRLGSRTLATLMAQAIAREWGAVDIAPLGMYTDTSRWDLPNENPRSFKASVGPYGSWAAWLDAYAGDNTPFGYAADQVSPDVFDQMTKYVRSII